MMMAITFSCQNHIGSHMPTTWYWENLILIDILILESKAL